MANRVRICFVCLGNICRSPTAEGIMRHLVQVEGLDATFEIDSAGTSGWHVGEPPDARASETARGRGFQLGGASRQFKRADFARFDYVIAMDRSNRDDLDQMAPSEESRRRIHMLRDFDPSGARGADVPDPYYGGARGFEDVFDICEAACRGLLDHLRRNHEL